MSAFGSCKFPGIPADRTRLVGGGVLDAPSRKAAVFAGSTLLSGWVLRDCHVGLWPPRNDKLGAFTILTMACTDCKCLPEIATGAKRPRNDNSGVHTILAMACTDRQHCAGPGCPLPYKARAFARQSV